MHQEIQMKMTRYSEPQNLAILRQAEGGMPAAELCREHGMSTASFFKWRAKYGGMDASMIAQTKALEDESRRLKKMFAELGMQNELLKEALGKMYGPPRYCKVFVGDAPACVNVSGL
jgi:putative transposase